jgi:hypothetical protein
VPQLALSDNVSEAKRGVAFTGSSSDVRRSRTRADHPQRRRPLQAARPLSAQSGAAAGGCALILAKRRGAAPAATTHHEGQAKASRTNGPALSLPPSEATARPARPTRLLERESTSAYAAASCGTRRSGLDPSRAGDMKKAPRRGRRFQKRFPTASTPRRSPSKPPNLPLCRPFTLELVGLEPTTSCMPCNLEMLATSRESPELLANSEHDRARMGATMRADVPSQFLQLTDDALARRPGMCSTRTRLPSSWRRRRGQAIPQQPGRPEQSS